jgi:4-hydroxy-3-polyprenylbenzoate decarboxylase
MEQALNIWQEEGLPPLRLRNPWFGYPLGLWSAEDDAWAEGVTQGNYFRGRRKE